MPNAPTTMIGMLLLILLVVMTMVVVVVLLLLALMLVLVLALALTLRWGRRAVVTIKSEPSAQNEVKHHLPI